MKAITEVDGDIATVRAFTTRGHECLADLLTKAAGPERVREVRSISTGGRGFRVPLDIAQAAGLLPRVQGDTVESESFDGLAAALGELGPTAAAMAAQAPIFAAGGMVEPADDQQAEEQATGDDATQPETTQAQEDSAEDKPPAKKTPAKKAPAKKAPPAADNPADAAAGE